ncbi:MAG: tRNA (N6-isopentenyl adenosine(37)-C2)-methylthiotransferase MiaB [Candidatus Ornithospirochaeta sp.]|nr:tRNA (N6-isopentenyl adenosine(37)-C2)-methylthiotransferase MiaB [Candidatus Ornithospirochaeta sp.]
MRYLIESYGCQMNIAESNALELILKGRGFEKTEDSSKADAVIINTCSVRKTAENRIWGRLGYFNAIKRKRDLRIIVTGCMAERMKEELKKEAPYIDLVVGTNDKSEIPDFLEGSRIVHQDSYSFLGSYYQEGEFSSYVPIMNGCNNFCSYCIVPYVRGREVSRSVEDIIKEIRFLESKGVREITLLGQNVNSYHQVYQGRDVDFPELLSIITGLMENIIFVRFESPHPKDFSDRLIEEIRRNERVAKHIHLPMQSGSTRILKLMNRKNTREDFISLIDRMRTIEGLTFATDVMTGFPSETEEEYEETLSLMEYMGCTEAFMYYFNPREGTRAFDMPDQIPDDVKIRRLERLIEEQLERQSRIKKGLLPYKARVIVQGRSRDDESMYLSRGEHNDFIVFPAIREHKAGDVVFVEARELSGNTFKGAEIV